MTWRDDLRPASFRGVPFLVFGYSATIGRRGPLHEYPRRNLPYWEDLGRRGRGFTFDAFVLQPDYPDVRDQLIKALERAGTGKLVHPTFGEQIVGVSSATVSEQPGREGGMARFSLTLVEGGDSVFPGVRIDTTGNVASSAAATQAAINSSFAARFSAAAKSSSVFTRARAAIGGVFATLNTLTGKLDLSGAINTLQSVNSVSGSLLGGASNITFLRQLGQLQGQITDLVMTPAELATSISGLIGNFQSIAGIGGGGLGSFGIPGLGGSRFIGTSYSAAGGTPVLALADAYPSASIAALVPLGLVDQAPAAMAPIVDPNDPFAAVIAQNDTAVSDLVRQSALVTAVTATSTTVFTSQDDAIAVRDGLSGLLDAEALTCSDDDLSSSFRLLRVAMVRDLTDRAADLPALMQVTPVTTIPAILLAYQLYDDPDQAADIIARNNVVHPDFLPVVPLTVLSNVA